MEDYLSLIYIFHFLFCFSYSKAKQRYLGSREELTPSLHLASAAEAGALVSKEINGWAALKKLLYCNNTLVVLQVCLCTNPIWLVKTRLQLQTPQQHTQPYSGFHGLCCLLFILDILFILRDVNNLCSDTSIKASTMLRKT